MPAEHVFYYRSPIHRDNFVLSFGFCFDLEDERYHFALSQPYSLSRLGAYVDGLREAGHDFLQVQHYTGDQ